MQNQVMGVQVKEYLQVAKDIHSIYIINYTIIISKIKFNYM